MGCSDHRHGEGQWGEQSTTTLSAPSNLTKHKVGEREEAVSTGLVVFVRRMSAKRAVEHVFVKENGPVVVGVVCNVVPARLV